MNSHAHATLIIIIVIIIITIAILQSKSAINSAKQFHIDDVFDSPRWAGITMAHFIDEEIKAQSH